MSSTRLAQQFLPRPGPSSSDAVPSDRSNVTKATAPAPAPKVAGTNDEETATLEGMHRVDGRIYKVQRAIHGSGNLYAKGLAGEGDSWTFVYAPGAIRNLSAATKMTLEEAKEFGALYGTCCVCARTLTNEASIEAGIGPVCAKKF